MTLCGLRVISFEGKVILGSKTIILHINSLVSFALPTRDKLTHREQVQMLQSAKTNGG